MIRSILLHADATAGSAHRLRVARSVALEHGASLTGVFGTPPQERDTTFACSAGAEFGTAAAERRIDLVNEAVAHLQHEGCNDGLQVTWLDAPADDIVPAFVHEAAYADLLVVGQPDPDSEKIGGTPAGFIASIVIDSGRPALVVPNKHRGQTLGKRVLIAWNGSKSSARAVTGAMAFLRRATDVHVVTWAPRQAAQRASKSCIEQFLQRHGIAATLHQGEPVQNAGLAAIDMVRELGADLLVMGCYGRSRTSERVLGGATRSMLAAMDAPVLLTH